MEESASIDFARMKQMDEGVPTVVKSKAEVESDCKWFIEWGYCVGPGSRYTSRKMATRKNS